MSLKNLKNKKTLISAIILTIAMALAGIDANSVFNTFHILEPLATEILQ